MPRRRPGRSRMTPDCVLLDVMLPGASGFELCRDIRAESDVPILFLSARDGDADKIRGLGLGADDYIVKSATPAEVVARVKAVLRRSGAGRRPGTASLRPPRGRSRRARGARRRQAGADDRPRVRVAAGARRASAAGVQPRASVRARLGKLRRPQRRRPSTSAGCARRSRTTRPSPATSSPSGAPATGSTATSHGTTPLDEPNPRLGPRRSRRLPARAAPAVRRGDDRRLPGRSPQPAHRPRPPTRRRGGLRRARRDAGRDDAVAAGPDPKAHRARPERAAHDGLAGEQARHLREQGARPHRRRQPTGRRIGRPAHRDLPRSRSRAKPSCSISTLPRSIVRTGCSSRSRPGLPPCSSAGRC